MAAFQENQFKCNLEFLRSSKPGVGRVIRFNHGPEAVPMQLQNRLSLEAWQAFMRDVDGLAASHPYVEKPGAKDVGKWSLSFLMGAVVGLFCINPDAGDYGAWESQAQQVIYRNFGTFQAAGAQVSLQHAGRDYWLQIDIDPSRIPSEPVKPPAEGVPAVAMMGAAPIPSPFASTAAPSKTIIQ